MELPEDVLCIIKEYAKPCTRPNWRTLHRMTIQSFYYNICNCRIHIVETIREEANQQWLKHWKLQDCHQKEHNWTFTSYSKEW